MTVKLVPKPLRVLLRDYLDSWTILVDQAGRRARRRLAAYLYGVPTLVASVFFFWHVQLASAAPFLAAMSIFTALLFGLLFLVFNLAVTIRKDGSAIENAHGLSMIVRDLRAIITYSIVVAVILVILLAVATQFSTVPAASTPAITATPGPSQTAAPAPVVPEGLPGLFWIWTPFLVWFAVHLVLNILSVLTRFRTAFNYISQ